MNWKAFELHTHTVNSDGTFTLKALCDNARNIGLEGIALTDHNTVSGLVHADDAAKETGVYILNGTEWTTFYGHMIALGIKSYVDWFNIGRYDIHKGIKSIHEQGAAAGIAHPYSIGSPLCTGCRWEYPMTDWNDVDYIEIWSGRYPAKAPHNKAAFDLWTSLLNKGYKIGATSGRDWHGPGSDEGACVTYIKTDLDHDEGIVKAIKAGKLSLSIGPLLLLYCNDGEIGDTVNTEGLAKLSIRVEIDPNRRAGHFALDDAYDLIIDTDQGVLINESINLKNQISYIYSIQNGHYKWMRAMLSQDGMLIALTNPIYYKEGE